MQRTNLIADALVEARSGGSRALFAIRGGLCWVAAMFLGLLPAGAQETAARTNVLVLIADDLGVDRVAAYGHRNADGQLIAPQTPNIDRLAKSGVLFRNAWAAPLCSPSRAMALTGMYPSRTGLGRFIPNDDPSIPGLNPDLLCLPDILAAPYLSAAIGKWHLATPARGGRANQSADHPSRCGFDVFRGTVGNLQTRGQSYTHFDWVSARLGALDEVQVRRVRESYVTSFTTDEALETIQEFADAPWFLWVGYHAPHQPLNSPPKELVQNAELDMSTKLGKGKAMIEALDTEIGRLLAGIDEQIMKRTVVVFFGDNGTQRNLIEAPFQNQRGKGSIYSNGVQVPFIVAGDRLPETSRGQECHALIDLTDLLPSVADLLGLSTPEGLDGHSFVPALADPSSRGGREWIFGERFDPNFDPRDGQELAHREFKMHLRTIRGERYKLVVQRSPKMTGVEGEVVEFYDLQSDFHEERNLLDAEGQPPLEAKAAFDRLQAQLESLRERD